jgi:outer membrane biosynthesis protein TonB
MLPIAIGLHVLVWAIPTPSSHRKAEPPATQKAVKIVRLPKPSPKSVPSVRQSPPTPPVQPAPAVSPSAPAASPSPRPALPSQPKPLAQPVASPAPSPSPIASSAPSPAPSASPVPSPPPSSPGADVLHLNGASPGCNGQAECWQINESNGRTVAGKLEQQLEQQGFVLTEKDLNQDTGFRVYEVAKDGVKQYYLHLIWSDRGTVYLRNQTLLSQSQLSEISGV